MASVPSPPQYRGHHTQSMYNITCSMCMISYAVFMTSHLLFMTTTVCMTSHPRYLRKKLPLYDITVQFSSVTQSSLTLCDPMNRSTPGVPVHHHLPEYTHTHIHRICDAIQPSHPLSSPSPPAHNASQHQSLFQ